MSLFSDLENNKVMIMGAYKKLKSYYYYDKTLLHNKSKLAIWENDKSEMQRFVHKLGEFLCTLENDIDTNYFKNLTSKIDFIVLPKTFSSNNDKVKEEIISNDTDFNETLKKVNFFIQAPVEILILDMLWTLFIGKIAFENDSISKDSYANKLKTSSIYNAEKDLFAGIDFHSNRAFVPYFQQYSAWKDNAFELLRERYYDEKDSVLITLDLKSYYYSVRFKFEKLKIYLKNDQRLNELHNLTEIMKTIYTIYTLEVQKYRGSIPACCEDNECSLPIGLISCSLLGNLYLTDFDNNIKQVLNPVYYGRYVDDMLLIIDKDSIPTAQMNKESILIETFIKRDILNKINANEYVTCEPAGLILQGEKIKCFYFNHKASSSMIDIIYEQGRTKASEYNLLPDFEFDSKSQQSYFDSKAYLMDSVDGAFKIRDFILSTNNFHAVCCINNLIAASKNTNNKETKYQDFIILQLKQIDRFYSGIRGIEYRSAWINIFSLALISENYDFMIDFYWKTKHTIDILETKEIYEVDPSKLEHILQRVRQALLDQLKISISVALALCSDDDTENKFKFIIKESYKENEDLNQEFKSIFRVARDLRTANMFNHHLISIPLLNYIKTVNKNELSYLELNLGKVSENIDKETEKFSFLDRTKLDLSPRFIHISELFMIYFIANYSLGGNIFLDIINEVLEFFYEINYINIKSPLIEQKVKRNINGDLQFLQMEYDYKDKKNIDEQNINVALASIYIDELDDVLPSLHDPKLGCSLKFKNEMNRLLNEAQKMGANIIVFPEYFLPFAWVEQLSRFSREYGITIISGLQYLTHSNQAYNFSAILCPFTTQGKFKHCLPLFREKNDYAPMEQEMLSCEGYKHINTEIPSLRIIKWNNFSFSDILCFEFTNIYYRTLLKANIDALVIPELNKDTNYFSSIVESVARDLHCYTIQANTSKYGDSRITAPYNSHSKNIIQIKGGNNNVVLLGELKIHDLHEKRKNDQRDLEKRLKDCWGKKIDIEKAKAKEKNYPIKGLPARFYKKGGGTDE